MMRNRWLLIVTFLTWGVVVAPSLAWSQLSFGVGGDNVEAESSLVPFKIMLRGAINAPARDDSLGYLRLSISDYHATYDFDVLTVQAVDDARITAWAILQQYKNGKHNLILDGPKELLSKIGQAEPRTPLMITGFLQQRRKTLRLTKVEIIGIEDLTSPLPLKGKETEEEKEAE
jgi:hypothetical protein